jgi:hypothetical protein
MTCLGPLLFFGSLCRSSGRDAGGCGGRDVARQSGRDAGGDVRLAGVALDADPVPFRDVLVLQGRVMTLQGKNGIINI